MDGVPAQRGEERRIRAVRIAAAQTEYGAGGGRETQIKRRRLEANDAVLNTKDGKLRDLLSLITIMQTSSRHRN